MMDGRVVYVRYRDHVLFKDINPKAYGPQVRETIGWLAEDNEDHIRIEWERFNGSAVPDKLRQYATGLVILRSCILELREVG